MILTITAEEGKKALIDYAKKILNQSNLTIEKIEIESVYSFEIKDEEELPTIIEEE